MILVAYLSVATWILTLIFKELGFIFYYTGKKEKANITFSYDTDYGYELETKGNSLKHDEDKITKHGVSIFIGSIPILVASLIQTYYLWILIPYLILITKDIFIIVKCLKTKKY